MRRKHLLSYMWDLVKATGRLLLWLIGLVIRVLIFLLETMVDAIKRLVR